MPTIAQALAQIGFSEHDIALFVLCPLGALIGSFVHMFIVENDFTSMPQVDDQPRLSKLVFSPFSWIRMLESKRWYWVWGRVFIGLATGLLVALYFTGSVTANAASSAKILALSILAGYLAPKLFIAQEKVVIQAVEKALPAIVEGQMQKLGQRSPEKTDAA